MSPREVVVTENSGISRTVAVGRHRLPADEPAPAGDDQGPGPFEFVLAGLGACTSMTLRMYADRHAWDLRKIEVRVRLDHRTDPPGLIRKILLDGDLDRGQRARLVAIAARCPVDRLMRAPVLTTRSNWIPAPGLREV